MSSVRLPLHKVYNGILAHTDEQYPNCSFYVDVDKRRQTAQLNVFGTDNGLREMIGGKPTLLLMRRFRLRQRSLTEGLDLWKGAS